MPVSRDDLLRVMQREPRPRAQEAARILGVPVHHVRYALRKWPDIPRAKQGTPAGKKVGRNEPSKERSEYMRVMEQFQDACAERELSFKRELQSLMEQRLEFWRCEQLSSFSWRC